MVGGDGDGGGFFAKGRSAGVLKPSLMLFSASPPRPIGSRLKGRLQLLEARGGNPLFAQIHTVILHTPNNGRNTGHSALPAQRDIRPAAPNSSQSPSQREPVRRGALSGKF